MFCTYCGTFVNPELSFCNRCGKDLRGKDQEAEKPVYVYSRALLWTMLAVSLGGLGLIMGFLLVMRAAEFATAVMVLFLIFGFTLIFGVTGLLFWLMLRGREEVAPSQRLRTPGATRTREIEAAQPNLLPEPPAFSVTEHTTRHMEPVPVERKTK